MKPIQEPLRAQELVTALGLKGRTDLQVDEIVVPTINLGLPGDSPFNRVRNTGFAWTSRIADAASQSVLLIEGARARGHIVGLTRLIVRNGTGAAIVYRVMALTATEVSLVVQTGSIPFTAMNPWNQTQGPLVRLAPVLEQGTTPGVFGTTVLRFGVPAASHAVIELPQPLFLYGDNPNVGGITLTSEFINTLVEAAFFVDVYRVSA